MKKLSLVLFLAVCLATEINAAEKEIGYPSTFGIEIGMSLTEVRAKADAQGLKVKVNTHREDRQAPGAPRIPEDIEIYYENGKAPKGGSGRLTRQIVRAHIYPKNPKHENVEESGWFVFKLHTYYQYELGALNLGTALAHYVKTYGPIRSAFRGDSDANLYIVFNPLQTTGQDISVAQASAAEVVGNYTAPTRRCSEGLKILGVGLGFGSDPGRMRGNLTDRYGKTVFPDWAQCKHTVLVTLGTTLAGPEGQPPSQQVTSLSVVSGDLKLIEPLMDAGGKIYRMASGAGSTK